MCAEEYGPVLLVVDKQVPGGPPGIGVHPRGWLIQHHKLGASNHSIAHTIPRVERERGGGGVGEKYKMESE